jgi:hypothetical protein
MKYNRIKTCKDCTPSVVESAYFQYGTVTQSKPCGCDIAGTGTLPDPWHIHFCKLHAEIARITTMPTSKVGIVSVSTL